MGRATQSHLDQAKLRGDIEWKGSGKDNGRRRRIAWSIVQYFDCADG
jgi:hypothetical protein